MLRMLMTLRYWAAVGQVLAITAAVMIWNLELNWQALAIGPAALLSFNAWLHARRPSACAPADNSAPQLMPTDARAFLHLAFDVAELSYVIALSGGVMNPFSSMFLVPVALATLALPTSSIWAAAALAISGYAASALVANRLAHIHGLMQLHLWGMAINFLLCCLVFVLILTRLAASRQHREIELAKLREFAARARGLTYLASHTAALAHGLNTPLGSLSLALEDALEDAYQGIASDPKLIADSLQIVHVCRDQIRTLVQDARARSESQDATHDSIVQLSHTAIQRWQLLRPEIQLHVEADTAVWPALTLSDGDSFIHLLCTLLDNAADASLANDRCEVRLRLRLNAQSALIGEVHDQGSDDVSELSVNVFRSAKSSGFGLGLAVCQLSIDQWQGSLEFERRQEGTCSRFRIPLSAPANADG
jgi:two-component system, sensor histidine kinase RegB